MRSVKSKLSGIVISLLCGGILVNACATADESSYDDLKLGDGESGSTTQPRNDSGTGTSGGTSGGGESGTSGGGESGSQGASGSSGSSGSSGGDSGKSGGSSGGTSGGGSSGAKSGSSGGGTSGGTSGGKSGSSGGTSGSTGKADAGTPDSTTGTKTLAWKTTVEVNGDAELLLDFSTLDRPDASAKLIIKPVTAGAMGVGYTVTIGTEQSTGVEFYKAITVTKPTTGNTVPVKINVNMPAIIGFAEG